MKGESRGLRLGSMKERNVIILIKFFAKNKKKVIAPRLGLEPRSKAPEAPRISSTLPGQPYDILADGI